MNYSALRVRPCLQAWIAAVACGLLGCHSEKLLRPERPHQPTPETNALFFITAAAISPGAEVEVPGPPGVVVWFNQTESFVSLAVETEEPSTACTTTSGFRYENGHMVTVPSIAPGDFATLCFHTSGVFAFKVYPESLALKGVVRVFKPEAEEGPGPIRLRRSEPLEDSRAEQTP